MSDDTKQASMSRHPSLKGDGRTVGSIDPARDGATDNQNGTSVTVTRNTTDREMTTIDGSQVRYDSNERRDTHVSGEWPAEADQHVRGLISDAIKDREARENVRANHRNLNRMLTLVFTLLAGLGITFLLNGGYLGHFGIALAPYSFVITVTGDTFLTLYSLLKHY